MIFQEVVHPTGTGEADYAEQSTRPYTSRTNGKAERFIQTALREWTYARHYASSEERDQQLSPWLRHYNFTRPHGSLGYVPPISRTPSAGTTS